MDDTFDNLIVASGAKRVPIDRRFFLDAYVPDGADALTVLRQLLLGLVRHQSGHLLNKRIHKPLIIEIDGYGHSHSATRLCLDGCAHLFRGERRRFLYHLLYYFLLLVSELLD